MHHQGFKSARQCQGRGSKFNDWKCTLLARTKKSKKRIKISGWREIHLWKIMNRRWALKLHSRRCSLCSHCQIPYVKLLEMSSGREEQEINWQVLVFSLYWYEWQQHLPKENVWDIKCIFTIKQTERYHQMYVDHVNGTITASPSSVNFQMSWENCLFLNILLFHL